MTIAEKGHDRKTLVCSDIFYSQYWDSMQKKKAN